MCVNPNGDEKIFIHTVIMLIRSFPFFFATFITAITLRQNEELAALGILSLMFILVMIMQMTTLSVIVALGFGLMATCAEWVCVRMFDMWKYNYTKYDVPIWLPFAWSMAAIFALVCFTTANALWPMITSKGFKIWRMKSVLDILQVLCSPKNL